MINWNNINLLSKDFKWCLFRHKHGAIVKGFSTHKNFIYYLALNGELDKAPMTDFTHFVEVGCD